MNQLQAIEALSAALGIRIRKATRPSVFAFLRKILDGYDIVSFDERMRAIGYEDDEAIYQTDDTGRIIALYLPKNLDEAEVVLEPLRYLVDLELLACDFHAGAAAARRLASLPHLAYLAVGLAERESDAAWSALSQATALEALLIEDGSGELDLGWLRSLPRLRSFSYPSNAKLANLDCLADCPNLRHLAIDRAALAPEHQLWRLSWLETLAVFGKADQLDGGVLKSLSRLRSLYLDEGSVPVETLLAMGDLRSLQMAYGADSLEPLAALPQLEVLALSSTQLSDLSALRRLPHLRHFSITDGATTDITQLQGLESIAFLDLAGNPITRYPEHLSMPNLRHLEWKAKGSARLSRADFLADCEALEVLNLNGHALPDLSFLRTLGNLRNVDLKGNELTDIEPLTGLPNLESLDIASNQVSSLAPLAQNIALTRLSVTDNPIQDVAVLGGLHRLEDLDLQGTGTTDLSFVKRLRNLFSIDASNNGIDMIEPLLELPHLGRVNLSGNRIRSVSREAIEGLGSLESLELEGNPIDGIDPELYSGDGRRALQSLRDYFRGLARGSVKHDQAKLLLVGNGRVGKTSLVTRLIDDAFDPAQPSTHGIQLRAWSLPHAADDKLDGQPLRVAVWDFGGQDIYYATHRLFMRTRALFLLVWDRKTEAEAYSLDELGERYENFRLPYWLDYIKALSGSPVLIVQNKVDRLSDKDLAYGVELLRIYPPPDGIVDFLYVSASNPQDSGMATLVDHIRQSLAAMDLIGRDLPAQWVEVRDRLAAMDRRYLDYPEYEALCFSVGMQGREPESLVRFLHQAGALFYDPQHFGERLILDQKWAIDAVYALLDRRGAAYRTLRAAGRNGLTLDLLKSQVWRHFSADEHQLLLGFMMQCELCFELGTGRYYVPQLLPEDMPSRVARRWTERTPYCLQISYNFLHRAIIDRFLVRAGRLGADDEPEIWRNGVVILERGGPSEALVEAFPGEGRILVQSRGPRTAVMLQTIRKEFDEVRGPFAATVWVSADRGKHWVDAAVLEQHVRANMESVLSVDQVPVRVASLADLLGDPGGLRKGVFAVSAASAAEARADAAGPEIFISYAWGDPSEDGESREAIVDRLHDELQRRQHRVIRDKKDAGYRSVISEFMKRLGQGKLVVAVISDKYLKSPYCMFELLEIYRSGNFQERVFPIVLSDAEIRKMTDRLEYILYWKQEKQKVEELINEIEWKNLSHSGTFEEYDRYYKDVFNHLDLLMTILNDWNALTPQLLEENSFDRLITAIEEEMS